MNSGTQIKDMNHKHTADTYRADERAVSEILGAILVFGLVLAVVVLIQVMAVPGWNQQVEFDHSERVQDDMGELGNSINAIGTNEGAGSTSVDLGVRYPNRPFLINPSPAEGSLGTVPMGAVTIDGARSSGEVGDYWDGSRIVTYDTQAVTYSSNYKEFRDAPVAITYEHGIVASSYDHDATLVRQSSPIVSGNAINLVTLTGTIDKQGIDRTTVPVTAMSRSPATISVTGDGGDDITISLPTTLPEEIWTELLSAERDTGNLLALEYNDGDPATVTLVLDGSVTYDLRSASIGVGDGPQPTQPSYLDRLQGGGAVVPLGSSERLTVEVRDQFNAPKSGVEVTFEVVAGGGEFRGSGIASHTVTSNANGQASAVFAPTSKGQSVVNATATLNDEPDTQEEERVRFTVTTPDDTGGDGDIINPRDPNSVTLDTVDVSGGSVTMTFENLADSSRQWTEIRIPFLSKSPGQALPATLDITPENRNTLTVALGEDFRAITQGPDNTPSPLLFDSAGTAGATKTVTVDFPPGQQLNQINFFVVTVLDQNGTPTTYFVPVSGT